MGELWELLMKPMILALVSQGTFLLFQQGALDISTTAVKDPPNTNHSSKIDIKYYQKRGQDSRIPVMLRSK